MHEYMCSTDLYKSDLQNTITLFTRNVSSQKTNWIPSESTLPVLSCLLYCRLSSLMNTFGGFCLFLCEIFINANKLLAVLVLPVYLFICFFILMLLLYFCLFVGCVKKPIIFVFGIFVYHFKNTISIVIKIYFFKYGNFKYKQNGVRRCNCI